MNHVIPPITHELGRSWKQPSRGEILVDDKHALMNERTLKQLHEYSASVPTGVYEGKMWRRLQSDGWLLCWYGPSNDPTKCSINFRPVLIVNDSTIAAPAGSEVAA